MADKTATQNSTISDLSSRLILHNLGNHKGSIFLKQGIKKAIQGCRDVA